MKDIEISEVINAAGPMTSIGASRIRHESIEAMKESMRKFIKIDELQDKASEIISNFTGAEAGWVTASAASGVSAAIAACMTGTDIKAIENLPDTGCIEKDRVVLQQGHEVRAGGALISTLIEMTGAEKNFVGFANETKKYQLEAALKKEEVAAVLHVINPRISKDLLPLEIVIEVAKSFNAPVIVDAAAEFNLERFIDMGADIVICSGHKYISGPTSGLLAGNKSLIKACRLQERGIARAMKVGKEGIVGLIAALKASKKISRTRRIEEEDEINEYWIDRLNTLPGLYCVKEEDKWGNPITRVRIDVVAEEAGITAYKLSQKLKNGDPEIRVRDYTSKTSDHIKLEPWPLKKDRNEAKIVADRIVEIIEDAHKAMNSDLMKINSCEWE